MKVTYKKDGLLVNEQLISLSEIIKQCTIEKIKDEKLVLLKMEWLGWRGFEEGVSETIALPVNKIKAIKKYILGRTIYFGEIAGKHSDIFNTLDTEDIKVIKNQQQILDFLSENPNGHAYNHSFLHRFRDAICDEMYDDLSEKDHDDFIKLF